MNTKKTYITACILILALAIYFGLDEFSTKKTVNLAKSEPEITAAVKKNDTEKIKELLLAKADINEVDMFGRTPIFYAQSLEMLSFLISNGADINFKANESRTLLNPGMSSTFHTSYEATKLLLESGFQKDLLRVASPIFKYSPLHYSDQCYFCKDKDSYSDGLKNIELLLSYGADINAKNKEGSTPIFTLKDESKYFLIKNGADIYTINNKNENLLFKVRDTELFKKLIDSGLDRRIVNSEGQNLLFRVQNTDIIDLFINDVNVNQIDINNRSPIFYCSNIEKMKLLLKNGANVNIIDKWGFSPLHVYARDSRLHSHDEDTEFITLLLENGIDINHKNKNGKTALDFVKYGKMREFIKSKSSS